MFLFAVATGFELEPFQLAARASGNSWPTVLTGVGPVEAAWRLSAYLARLPVLPQGVINFGLAGAFPDVGLDLLDLCLADREVFGELGIIYRNGISPLPATFAPPGEFDGNPSLLKSARNSLAAAGVRSHSGRFVTVAGVSGTRERAEFLRDNFQAICENMEGAALARVCQGFGVPFLEVRCISNLAIDRDQQLWRAADASRLCGQAVAIISEGLRGEY